MFFTQEDYKKIQSWLQQNAIKDTEFKNGLSTLTGNEIIAIVQNGCNVKLYLKDFIEQLILLGLPDFVNITVKFHKKNIALEEAISLIPCLSRKIGQVITFIDEQGEWKIYQFQGGDITQWNNLTLWVDLLKQMMGTVSWDDIKNKPEFSPVAFSGDYEDLSNKPIIPSTENFVTETELLEKGYQTNSDVEKVVASLVGAAPETLDTLQELADALGDDPNFAATISEEIGKKLDTSTYNNEKSNFALKSEIPDISNLATKEELSAKQNTLVSGTNIKTINGNSILGEGNITIEIPEGGITDSPSDGKLYGRKNSEWTEVIIPDTSNLATKSEVTKGLNQKVDSETLNDYLTVDNASTTYATKTELDNKLNTSAYNSEKVNFALKTEIPTVPTNVSSFTNDAGYQTESDVDNKIATLVDSAPETLDTLNELATALNNDPNFATSISTELGNKLNSSVYESEKTSFALKTELDNYETSEHASTTYQLKGNYALVESIPTKVSELTNDSGYITADTSFDGRGTTEQRPSGLMMSNAGYRYYDSTIEQTIVWNGEDWCNEDMTLLSKVVII